MPKMIQTVAYTKEDIKKLDNMSNEDTILVLQSIQSGWLPRDYVYSPEDGEEYTESEYTTTKMYKAIDKAIDLLKEVIVASVVSDTEETTEETTDETTVASTEEDTTEDSKDDSTEEVSDNVSESEV